MPQYLTLFSYTSATWEKMTVHPNDRAAAIAPVAGPYDGIVIVDLPDGSAAAAMPTAATATGAYQRGETHPLIGSSALPAVLTRARTVGERFARSGT